MLGKLIAPMDHVTAAKALATMLSMPVFNSLPDTAFTIPSLEHVAGLFKRVPSYSELHAALEEWWSKNKPPAPVLLIEGPLSVGMSEDEKQHAASWLRNRAHFVKEGRLETSLNVLRDKWPGAFNYIIATHSEAASIAFEKGWSGLSGDAAASWDNPEAIRSSVRLVLSSPVHQLTLGKLLGRAVAVRAPQHLHNVPPDWHPTAEELAA